MYHSANTAKPKHSHPARLYCNPSTSYCFGNLFTETVPNRFLNQDVAITFELRQLPHVSYALCVHAFWLTVKYFPTNSSRSLSSLVWTDAADTSVPMLSASTAPSSACAYCIGITDTSISRASIAVKNIFNFCFIVIPPHNFEQFVHQ